MYEKLILGDKNELANVFQEYFVGQMDEGSFGKFAQKIRKNLVDGQIGDLVKNALQGTKDFDFEGYKKALKNIQDDIGGKGVLKSIGKILDVGETVLSFTPLGGAAKVAGAIGRGLFKIFG